MATGIILPELVNLAYGVTSAIIVATDKAKVAAQRAQVVTPQNGPWTPPEWAKPALTILTVPATFVTNPNAGGSYTASNSINYLFDAVIRASHRRTVRKTQHPVLTGSTISDHAYNEPSKLTLEIGMSDAMAAFSDNWTGWPTKSVSAWQILKRLEQDHVPLIITTRLDTYTQMLIEDCFALDENKTLHGLRATIIFGEVVTAGVLSQPADSARPQTSNNNSSGIVQSQSPEPSQIAEHVLPSPSYPDLTMLPVQGSGPVSSNSLGQLAASLF